jgi:hypothetical protein
MSTLESKQKAIKTIIELSKDCDEADMLVCKYAQSNNAQKKLSYLSSIFDFSIIGRHEEDADSMIETDYAAVLSAIVNKKWW